MPHRPPRGLLAPQRHPPLVHRVDLALRLLPGRLHRLQRPLLDQPHGAAGARRLQVRHLRPAARHLVPDGDRPRIFEGS